MRVLFSGHAEFRLKKRKILREEVLHSIKFPDKTIRKHGKYFFQKNIGRGKIEIVCQKTENNIKVITLYWI